MDDKSTSPILHSMQKDSVTTAQNIVGSSSVPKDEALLLAKMNDNSSKRRTVNFFIIVAGFILILSVVVVSLPDSFFMKKDTGIIPTKNETNFLRVDAVYGINLPTESELEKFRQTSFSNEFKLAEIKINQNGQRVIFKNLSPLVASRFLENVSATNAANYVYGIVTTDDNISSPYFAFSFADRKLAEKVLLNEERTIYTDLGTVMQLPINKEFELLQFEQLNSVRSPIRMLRSSIDNTLLVYGYPTDNIVLFARSKEAYEIVKNQMLTGY